MQYTISVYDGNGKCRVCGAHASEVHNDGCEVGALRKELRAARERVESLEAAINKHFQVFQIPTSMLRPTEKRLLDLLKQVDKE